MASPLYNIIRDMESPARTRIVNRDVKLEVLDVTTSLETTQSNTHLGLLLQQQMCLYSFKLACERLDRGPVCGF
jgi:hypothetical protein